MNKEIKAAIARITAENMEKYGMPYNLASDAAHQAFGLEREEWEHEGEEEGDDGNSFGK